MEVEPLAAVPLCTVCNHHHIQGVKCPTCGHVGRSQIYPKMRMKAAERRSFKVDFCSGQEIALHNGFWDIAHELRRQIFCVECGVDHQQEFVEDVEISSFHFIGISGNAPVGVGRYRVLLQPDGSAVALIDKVAILADWRRRGIGKHMISAMANHARHLQSPAVRRITAQTGEGSLVTNKLDALGVPRDSRFGAEWGIVFDVNDFTSQLP